MVKRGEAMELFIQVMIVAEILIVNMSIFYRNSTPKYSLSKIIRVILIYSILLIVCGLYALQHLDFFGNGNALFTILGFLYLPVLNYLFYGSYHDHFFIMCYAWIYTLTVFTISIQVGYIFIEYGLLTVALLTQTLILALTYKLIHEFIGRIYMKLLDCQDKDIRKYLDREAFIWFFTILLVNLNFIFQIEILKIFAFVVIFVNVIFSYLLLFEVLSKGHQIGDLQNKIAQDPLTKVGSRIGFEYSIKEKIKKKKAFILIYLDLDNFKDINDCFGHLFGDEYLRVFAHKLKQFKNAEVFRISGDEFVILSKSEEYHALISHLHKIDFQLNKHIRFKGVSIGYAFYPNEARSIDDLIYLADQRMYKDKQSHV